MKKKILLLGSGELGKELVISLKRLGCHVIAADSYPLAPAMQIADESQIINMLNGDALDNLVDLHKPDLIIPEIEAIRTERFYDYESKGFTVIPSAKAANFTMNRKAVRDLAAKDLQIKTASYSYADNIEDFRKSVLSAGFPCVVKPLMSSSGKGQSIVRSENEIDKAWKYAMEGTRGDIKEVIIEEFIPFESEITLLTVTQKNGPVLFCEPIGHRQEHGDYRESWQPASVSPSLLEKGKLMAEKITTALGGPGIWGVEFFLTSDEIYFSELSPRPHDTGMVTLSNNQQFTQFDLHARAVLGLPIPEIKFYRPAASAVILADSVFDNPEFTGVQEMLKEKYTDIRIFGKPSARVNRRMAVVLLSGNPGDHAETLAKQAANAASKIKVVPAEK